MSAVDASLVDLEGEVENVYYPAPYLFGLHGIDIWSVVLMDFDLKRRSRICSATERELTPGEKYFSAVVEVDGEVIRRDTCAAEWKGPPENCVGWWQSRIPPRDPNRFFWAPDDVIIDFFERYQSIKGKEVEQYVLALLLIQKKIFRLEESVAPIPPGSPDPATQGDATAEIESTPETPRTGDTMHVYCARRDQRYDVPVAPPANAEVQRVQNELIEILFSDEPFDAEEPEEPSLTDAD